MFLLEVFLPRVSTKACASLDGKYPQKFKISSLTVKPLINIENLEHAVAVGFFDQSSTVWERK